MFIKKYHFLLLYTYYTLLLYLPLYRILVALARLGQALRRGCMLLPLELEFGFQWKQHASAARGLAKSGQGYWDPVELQVRQ